MSSKTLYVLRLCDDKYYIGITNRLLSERLIEHFSNSGSAWTKLYKPLEIMETFSNPDDFDEDKYTKKYMKLYGIQNVRGGSYVKVDLQDYQIKSLEQELCTRENKCFKCGLEGHFLKDRPKFVKSNSVNPGDWTCQCGEINFRKRDMCRKCKIPKPWSVI